MNKRYYSYDRIHPLAHQYSFGSALKEQMQAPDWSKVNMGALANAGIGVASKVINPSGNTSGAGEAVSTVGDVLGVVNPLWGAIAKGAGALINAAFGSNVNEEAVKGLGQDITTARNNIGTALTEDTLVSSLQDLSGINVAGADLGTQGWFNHDVDNARESLLKQKAQADATRTYAVDNINTLANRQMAATALADGGSIHIKPSKKGTFTAAATKHGKSVQEFASQVLANPENYSPAMRKKANFARNAAKWHADGGSIFKTDYDMDLSFINAGGTHEQNPFGGVFMGISPDGEPNQVEEGEVIFNDYVFSNRLKVPKAVRNKYKLRETKDETFADAFKEYVKKNGIEERNNDPIANRGLEAFASELAMIQEVSKAKKEMKDQANSFAPGGYILYDKGYNDFDKLYADDSQYMKSLKWLQDEENASTRDNLINDIIAGKYGTVPASRADDIRNNWYTLATDSKKGPVHNAMMDFANRQYAQAQLRQENGIPKIEAPAALINNNIATPEAKLPPQQSVVPPIDAPSIDEEEGYDPAYRWRMAGLGANTAGLMWNILDPYKPPVLNEVGAPRTINPRFLGDYIAFTPYDINYATSQQDANSAATRRALMQSIAPIRNAYLLANDFNANATRGLTRRQALEYNDAQRKAVQDFNRNTNEFNIQMALDAASKNQAARQAYYESRLRQAQINAANSMQHKMARDQAIGQGITSIADYLNDMGREREALNMIDAEIKSGARDTNKTMDELLTSLYGRTGDKRTKKERRGK